MASARTDIRTKRIFSTGEAAKICNVSQQTIIRCFDHGELEGFRVPGSRFRRIPREALLRFMQHHDMATTLLDVDGTRVLIVGDGDQFATVLTDELQRRGRFEVRTATTEYQAGMLTEQFKPQLMILDVRRSDIDAAHVCRLVRRNPAVASMKIVIVTRGDRTNDVQHFMAAGGDACFQEPVDMGKIADHAVQLIDVPSSSAAE